MRATTKALLCAAAVVAGAAVAPAPAGAVENIWKRWVRDIDEREYKWEIPLAAVVSIPPMIVVTPFWLGSMAVEAISGDD
ncbi:MAG: hypothetical protein R3E88_16140 [Myxococcota bacterium]